MSIAGCGFSPVYTTDLGGQGAGTIAVAEIEGRSGYILRRELVRELATGLPGVEDGTLLIELEEELRRLSLNQDGSAARTDIIAVARYTLDTGDDAIIGEVDVLTSYTATEGQFADVAAQQDGFARAMRLLSQEISSDLRIQLANR
ncbi:MAG: LPS assembly lipoprotein LptE [Pseudomonadota bacterium]